MLGYTLVPCAKYDDSSNLKHKHRISKVWTGTATNAHCNMLIDKHVQHQHYFIHKAKFNAVFK